MNVLGISCYFHDSAAALVCDGEVAAAAAEERFTRTKHDPEFPHQAIRFCLERGGLLAQDLDAVVFYEKPLVKLDRILSSQIATFPRSLPAFLKAMPQWLRRKLRIGRTMAETLYTGAPCLFADHHTSHAASSFLTSRFDRAAVLTVDGVGEWTTTSIGLGEGSSVRLDLDVGFPHSLGLLYSALTHHLGFRVNSGEWKVMALAAYGEPTMLDRFQEMVVTRPDGSFRLRMEYFDHHRNPARLFNRRAHELIGPPRRPGDPLTREHHDLARSGQLLLEQILLRIVELMHRRYEVPNLCLAGGVALNCVANGRLVREGPFDAVWVPPAPGDDGGALGAALMASGVLGTAPVRSERFSPYLGPEYSTSEIAGFVDRAGVEAEELAEDDLVERAADSLAQGRVIGWFQGRMEFGPRALGNRSILASPERQETKDRINELIKGREPFRPLAPSVLAESADRLFVDEIDSPFMSFVTHARPERAASIPAILHVDDSARLQTVDAEANPLYDRLLRAFERRTGIPAVLNTSLNVNGQPIACNPADALDAATAGGLDEIYLGRTVIRLGASAALPGRSAAVVR
ncbi:MAG: carbamoyltransferase N-terminal domain-containing protein [Acidobacteriota bacterium]|jgi:carbamoyltransferase